MLRLTRFIHKTLSVRISLMFVFAIATLLTVALLIMFNYSRKAIKQEAIQKAEQTLEGTVLQIDNVLLSVEQSAGNIYWELMHHLDEPDRMFVYSRKLVETNPYIIGAAIAFEPYYYKERGQYFMAYFHRAESGNLVSSTSPIIQSETFGNVPYTEQVWFTKPMKTGRAWWINPLQESKPADKAIISFCLPIYSAQMKTVGVLGVDISLQRLTEIALSAKPSPNSYATLIDSDGSYIVHPDSNKIYYQNILTLPDLSTSAREAGKAMVAGETGYRHITMNGTDCYIFFKPFKRSAVPGRTDDDLGWSAGIVYPEDDIFGDYNRLLYVVLMIVITGLLLLAILCQALTHRLLLPLDMLTKSAQRIAQGHYDETIPDTQQEDEVGRLQAHFQQMQQSLATHIGELHRLTTSLKERGDVLSEAYERAKEADRMKIAFLHNMTNQMVEPVGTISKNVDKLYDHYREMKLQEASRTVDDIQEQGKTITELLNDLLRVSQEEIKT